MAHSHLLNTLKLVTLVIGLLVVVIAASVILPQQSDWAQVYRPAAILLMSGQSPYKNDYYAAPPWILVPLLPIAALPERIGRVVIFMASIASYAYIAKKHGANVASIVFLIVSYPVVYGLIYGQIDWLAMFGLVTPPWLGAILLMAKPQVGIGVIIYMAYEAWKKGAGRSRVKNLAMTFAPLAFVSVVSLTIFGSDVFAMPRLILTATNTSLWPRSIPIGLVILLRALKHQEKAIAMTASPFLSPYVQAHSWAAAIIGLSGNSLFVIVVSTASWLVWVLGGGAVDR